MYFQQHTTVFVFTICDRRAFKPLCSFYEVFNEFLFCQWLTCKTSSALFCLFFCCFPYANSKRRQQQQVKQSCYLHLRLTQRFIYLLFYFECTFIFVMRRPRGLLCSHLCGTGLVDGESSIYCQLCLATVASIESHEL